MLRIRQILPVLVLIAACEGHRVAGPELPTLDAMRPALTRSLTPEQAERAFGEPNQITGSGLLIYVYEIEHAHSVHLGFAGRAPIVYAKLRAPGGKLSNLPLRD